MELTEAQRRRRDESDQEHARSNAQNTSATLTRMVSKCLVLSTSAEEYGYRDLAHALDAAAANLVTAQNEVKRLSSLTPAERASMYPTDKESAS